MIRLKDILNEGQGKYVSDVDFTKEELNFIMQLINNLGSGQHPYADDKTIKMFAIKYVKDLLKKGKNKIPSKLKSIASNVDAKLNK